VDLAVGCLRHTVRACVGGGPDEVPRAGSDHEPAGRLRQGVGEVADTVEVQGETGCTVRPPGRQQVRVRRRQHLVRGDVDRHSRVGDHERHDDEPGGHHGQRRGDECARATGRQRRGRRDLRARVGARCARVCSGLAEVTSGDARVTTVAEIRRHVRPGVTGVVRGHVGPVLVVAVSRGWKAHDQGRAHHWLTATTPRFGGG